jgi:hypothetical protein
MSKRSNDVKAAPAGRELGLKRVCAAPHLAGMAEGGRQTPDRIVKEVKV